MNELFHMLLNTIAVTGAEQAISRRIQNECRRAALSVDVLPNGSVIISPQNNLHETKTAVFVPIDSPGFIVLSISQKKAYLAPIGKLSDEIKNESCFIDEFGNEYRLIKADDDYFVEAGRLKIGDVLQPKSNVMVSSDKVSGIRTGQLALICALLDIIKDAKHKNCHFIFSTGSHERSAVEAQIVKQRQIDFAVLCGTLEDKGATPIIVIKDGKNLSDRRLIEKIKQRLTDVNIRYQLSCVDKAITKSEDITAREGIPTLTVALPVQNKGKISEGFEKEAYNGIIDLLTTVLN